MQWNTAEEVYKLRITQMAMKNCTSPLLEKTTIFQSNHYSMNDTVCVKEINRYILTSIYLFNNRKILKTHTRNHQLCLPTGSGNVH